MFDAQVSEAVRDLAGTLGVRGRRRLASEVLYGRRKMTARLPRTATPGVWADIFARNSGRLA